MRNISLVIVFNMPNKAREYQNEEANNFNQFLALIVIFPSTVFALNVYSTPVHADFVNLSWKINPSGTADIGRLYYGVNVLLSCR